MPESNPNPFDAFHDDAGAPMRPLPAAEVRRRGDRFRRRRTALVAAGAVAAVLAIAVPLAVVNAGAERTAPPIADTPSPAPADPSELPAEDPAAVLTTIPGDFEIDRGLPEGSSGTVIRQNRGDAAGSGMQFCLFDLLDRSQATDQLIFLGAEAEVEATRIRDLLVFPTERRAQSAVSSIRAGVEACPEEVLEGTTVTNGVAEVAGGITRVTREAVGGDGVTGTQSVWRVVRVNNAVFIDERSGESLRVPRPTQEQADLTPVLEQLCVFAPEGCPDVDTSPEDPNDPGTPTPEIGDIPEDFPLLAGWPEQPGEAEQPGRVGPDRTLGIAIDPDLCGAPFPVPAYRDHLEAAFTNVEDGRERVLYSFDDPQQAIAFVTEVLRTYQACPTETLADLEGQRNEVRRTSIGGQSYAFVTRRTYDGLPAIGLRVTHVVRLGRAVLVDTASGEGGASTDPEREIRAQLARQEGALGPVLTAMCRFTEAGC